MTKMITEAGTLTTTSTGRLEITLITPGWGSSGYYSAEMLEQAATDRVFARGTQMHIDHMGASERIENSAGSLRTLAAVLTEDAVWDPDYVDGETGNKGRLKAESMLGSQYREMVTEFADYIGTSISAGADVTIGEAEGRKGQIVEKLYPDKLNRVDFVTVAGRGGRIDAVLEAAVTRIAEATANETRDALSAAVRDAYGADGVWLWVLDYDDTNVWFTQESEDEAHTWQQAYTMADSTATLSGDLVEVRRVVSYTPITPNQESKDSPPVPAGVTENQEEATMATIDDKELATLRESAGRATVAESELTTATERATTAEAALQESNDSAAANLVTAALAEAGITAPKTAARLSKGYPVKENGALDAEKLGTEVAEAIAELAESNGAGSVRGLGQSDTEETTELTAESAREQILAARGYTRKGA